MSNPKLFISYCWTSKEHEEWVLHLGTELRENGVDVVLDKWDLKEGNDANAFMEKMVSDKEIKKVILIIDEQYSEKANKRKGGVGTETQIISAEVYESVEQNKFVAVIANRNGEGKAELPIFYKSRIYIDLSDEDLYGKNFEQLLRWVFDKPFNVKPELGEIPAFLDEKNSVSLGTSVMFRRLGEAIRNSKSHAFGAMTEYFDTFSNNLHRFRLEASNGAEDFDQKIIDNIEQFIPYRNELIETFSTIAQYSQSNGSELTIHKFFESLIPYLSKPEDITSYHTWDWDNLKFIVQEIFILCIAIFLKYEKYDVVDYLLSQRYYVNKNMDYPKSEMRTFGVFRSYLESLIYRNKRLKLNRLSVHADLMRKRSIDYGISFTQIMQADFILYLKEAMQAIKEKRRAEWWPDTLLYVSFHGAFEIFLRSESLEYFNKISSIFDVNSKSDFDQFLIAFNNGKVLVPIWETETINPAVLMNYEKLCSLV